MWFLLGIFAFLWCLGVVNRGEVVVECVANVVCCRSLFGGLKVGHLFQLYFQTADTDVRGFLFAQAIGTIRDDWGYFER
jgi:hypothetical protein